MPTVHQLQELAETNPAPHLLDLDTENKVFSHKSLFALPAHVKVRKEEPADWERLAFLGDQILSMCVTDIIFERYAYARPSFLTARRSLVVSNDQVSKWSQAYGFPSRIQAQPSQSHLLRSSLTAQASVFEAYIGAVYSSDGYQRAERWLKPLIYLVLDEADEQEREEEDQEEEGEEILDTGGFPWQADPPLEFFSNLTLDDGGSADPEVSGSLGSTPLSKMSVLGRGSSTPKPRTHDSWSSPSASMDRPWSHANEPARKASSETRPSALKFYNEGQPSTAAPSIAPLSPLEPSTPRPSTFYTASSTFSAPPPTTGNGFLALFNQIAAQKRIDPVWTTTSVGPAHKPTFQAVVIVGNKQGKGNAHNKQAAKQIAARDALKNLKWLIERRGETASTLFARRDTHRLWKNSFRARSTALPRLASLFRNCFRRLPG